MEKDLPNHFPKTTAAQVLSPHEGGFTAFPGIRIDTILCRSCQAEYFRSTEFCHLRQERIGSRVIDLDTCPCLPSTRKCQELAARGEFMPAYGEDLPSYDQSLPTPAKDLPTPVKNCPPVDSISLLEDRVCQTSGEILPACGEICPPGWRICPPGVIHCPPGVSLCPPGVRLCSPLESYARPWRDLPDLGETMPAHGEICPPMERYDASGEDACSLQRNRPPMERSWSREERGLGNGAHGYSCPLNIWKIPFKPWNTRKDQGLGSANQCINCPFTGIARPKHGKALKAWTCLLYPFACCSLLQLPTLYSVKEA